VRGEWGEDGDEFLVEMLGPDRRNFRNSGIGGVGLWDSQRNQSKLLEIVNTSVDGRTVNRITIRLMLIGSSAN
jgi:hypothetical protein